MLTRRFLLTTAVAVAVLAPTAAFAWRRPMLDPGFGPQKSASPLQIDPLDAATRTSRITWLEANATKLSSIDFDEDDFRDLESLRKAIGNSRIVMLGEMSHGDGTAFRAKARMVRFLHETMGFDVLAFESGLYDMHKVWEMIDDGGSARRAARRGLHGVWSRSRQVQPLLDYVGKRADSRRPLELAGFDWQLAGSASHDHMMDDLASFLADNKIDYKLIPHWRRFRHLMDRITEKSNDGSWKPSADDQKLMLATYDMLAEQLATAESDKADFWRQVIKSTKAMLEVLFRTADVKNPKPEELNARDAAMADNLVWLARHAYPQRKIIVWAASYHNARNYKADAQSPLVPMGEHVWKEFGEQVYSVAFTAFDGYTGWAGQRATELPAAPRDSLEELWNATSHRRAFLDLRKLPDGGDWLKAPFAARALVGETAVADWSKMFDGLVFLRTMRPSRAVD